VRHAEYQKELEANYYKIQAAQQAQAARKHAQDWQQMENAANDMPKICPGNGQSPEEDKHGKPWYKFW